MGAACRKSKVKDPKRKDMDELAERERLEREAAENAEREAAEQAENMEKEPEPEEEEVKEEEENQEEEEEEEEEPETNRVEETERTDEKPAEEMESSNSEIFSESLRKFDQTSEKEDSSSGLTLSTEATGAVQQVTKLSEPAHEESIQSTYRSVTPCDMNRVDTTAKNFSRRCGCDLGEHHEENNCHICRNVDLSDAPLLN